MSPIGERLGDVRRRRGFTQEQLAERSGVGVTTVRKLERGAREGRLATLHALARALDVSTSALFDPGPPAPADDGDDARHLDLMPLRAALTPVSQPVSPEQPDLAHLRDTLTDATRATREGAYGTALPLLPELITDARAAGDEAADILAQALHLSGWLLTQLRAYDLAYYPLYEASDVTAEATVTLAWLLIRQGRFEEALRCAAATADRVEPKLSTATDRELSTWVFLLLRASAAASRDNHPDEAAEMLRLAQAGTARIDPDRIAGPLPPYGVASRRLVSLKQVENAVTAGQYSKALRMTERVPERRGHVSLANHFRYRLDVAAAEVSMRDYTTAFDVLREVRRTAPEWLSHQTYGRHILSSLLENRARPVTDDMRDLADFLQVN